MYFPKLAFTFANISEVFLTTDLVRDILLFSTPSPRMSYGNNLPVLLSNMRKTHKINCAKGFGKQISVYPVYLQLSNINARCIIVILS